MSQTKAGADIFQRCRESTAFQCPVQYHWKKELTFPAGGDKTMLDKDVMDFRVFEQFPCAGIALKLFLCLEEERGDLVQALNCWIVKDNGVSGDAAQFSYKLLPLPAVREQAEADCCIE